jgi:hypothetical protein
MRESGHSESVKWKGTVSFGEEDAMHHSHTVAWLVDRLVERDCTAWVFVVAFAVALGIALIYDFWRSRRECGNLPKDPILGEGAVPQKRNAYATHQRRFDPR